MFKFRGRLCGWDFGAAFAVRLAVYAGITAGFPYIVMAIVNSSGCRGIGGACGAVALVAALYLKPIIFLVFVFSLLGITVRRLRDAGLPTAITLLPVALILIDWTFAMVFASPWSVAFVLGALFVNLPIFLISGIATLIAIGFLPTAARREYSRGFWMTGAMALTLALSLIFSRQVLPALLPIPQQLVAAQERAAKSRPTRTDLSRPGFPQLASSMYWSMKLKRYQDIGAGAYAMSLLAMVIAGRTASSPGSPPGQAPAAPAPGPSSPPTVSPRRTAAHRTPAAGGFGRRSGARR